MLSIIAILAEFGRKLVEVIEVYPTVLVWPKIVYKKIIFMVIYVCI